MTLTTQEKQALAEFINQNWSAFRECAAPFMSDSEQETLIQKLEGE